MKRQKIFFALGTVNTLTVFSDEYDDTLDTALHRVREIHAKLNAFDPESEVSLINKNAGISPVHVSEDKFSLILRAKEISGLTDGCFDITTRPLNTLWKQAIRNGKLPPASQIRKISRLTNYRDIITDDKNRTVMLRRRGMQADLGAIAKGYAADEVRRILISRNIPNAVINLGGTVVNMGDVRRIGIRDPMLGSSDAFAFTELGNRAIVTSGIYEQCTNIGSRLVHHITDPRTGQPAASDFMGITLIGNNACELDALATALFIMKKRNIPSLLQRFGAEAVFITKERKVFSTDGIKNNISLISA